jgi:integrase/recombinase XerD
MMEINVILTESFEKWMTTLNYAESTVYLSARYVQDFFFYLKSIHINTLEQIHPTMLEAYHKHLQTRTNKRQSGGLSPNYIASNINALKRFDRYLQVTDKGNLDITLKTQVNKDTDKTILSRQEIKALYQSCGNDYLGLRDKAILGIYYGCGLRRSEGVNLDVKDILLKEKLVFVRSGKGYKERYVPMTGTVRDHLEEYLGQGREYIQNFKKETKSEALFLSVQVKRLCGIQVMKRVQNLAHKAGIDKAVGLHTLRHSIATHLLQSGLTLEEVSQFSGYKHKPYQPGTCIG